jgi:hypothetical protein
MSSPKLPTLDSLNVSKEQIDSVKSDSGAVARIAQEWLTNFSKALEAKDSAGILSELQPDGFWRDLLALTWNLRTFHGQDIIKRFVDDRLFSTGFGDLKVETSEGMTPELQQYFPDLAWIQFFISFKVNRGSGSGVIRLVPTTSPNGPGKLTWKAHTILTTLISLDGFPEILGPRRNPVPNQGFWPQDREREINFLDREPAVVIIGGGQSGLEVAARLKCLGVESVILEKNKEVGQVSHPITFSQLSYSTPGQQWRDRYEALCLHDPVCQCSPFLHRYFIDIHQGMIICRTFLSPKHGPFTLRLPNWRGGSSLMPNRWSSTSGLPLLSLQ